MAAACVWSTAGMPREVTAGILFGRQKLLRALGAGTGRSRQGQGPSRPSWRPCWDSAFSLSGLQVRLVGPAQWSFEGPRGIATTIVCHQGLLLQGEWPVWGSQGAPDTTGQHLQQVYSEAAGAPFPPDGAAGVCTQRRRPVQGLGAGLGGGVGEGVPPGGADY